MTMEDIVRQRHALEDRIKEFQGQVDRYLKLAFRDLDIREHEIALARLFDLMNAAVNDADRVDKMFKGLLLTTTYERRKKGEKPPFITKLYKPDGGFGLYAFVNWQFRYPIPLTEQVARDWAAGDMDSTRKLLPSPEDARQ